MKRLTKLHLFAPCVVLSCIAAACTSSSSGGNPPCANPGAPKMGAQDTHCMQDGGTRVQPTNPASCSVDAGAGAGDDGGTQCAYGDTLYNTSGADDDCKYDVSYSISTSTPLCENADVYFTVTATKRAENSAALTNANPYIEAFFGTDPCFSTHPAKPTKPTTTEGPPGTYKIGPVQFDMPGVWTVRYHFNGDCADVLPDSPHGHAAFFINVP